MRKCHHHGLPDLHLMFLMFSPLLSAYLSKFCSQSNCRGTPPWPTSPHISTLSSLDSYHQHPSLDFTVPHARSCTCLYVLILFDRQHASGAASCASSTLFLTSYKGSRIQSVLGSHTRFFKKQRLRCFRLCPLAGRQLAHLSPEP